MDIAALSLEQIATAGKLYAGTVSPSPSLRLSPAPMSALSKGSEVTRVAIALLRFPSLELLEYQVARVATTILYIPGFLSFHEYPSLLAAWDKLGRRPDLLLVDGHGI